MKRVLGRSGIEVSATGMGCWAIGGQWTYLGSPAGWGEIDDAEDDDEHREQLLGVGEVPELAEPDGRDVDDRLVSGVEQGEAGRCLRLASLRPGDPARRRHLGARMRFWRQASTRPTGPSKASGASSSGSAR